LLPLYNAKSQKVQIRLGQILPTLRFYLFADLFIDRGGSFERPVQQNNTPGDPRRHYKRKKRCTVVCVCKIGSFNFRRKYFFCPPTTGLPATLFDELLAKSLPASVNHQARASYQELLSKKGKNSGKNY
jgi:hypothetical protein